VKNIFTTRRNIIIAGVAAVAVIGSAGAAFAYFTSTGTGTGSGTVGTATALTVSAGIPATTTPLFPGGTQNVTFTITNSGAQPVTLVPSEVTATIASTGAGGAGDVFKFAGTPIAATDATGCLASWFSTGTVNVSSTSTPSSSPAASVAIAASGGQAYVTVPVTMPADSTDNQDPCEGITGPKVTIQIAQ
jgi:hypothetical protein